ncbi:MAG: ankyrin repeat domain-containing protein [Desulfomonile tiedjei]|nr:ankyrin repeat domain-containing protein [Desulfomonile tiedjei]
MPRFIHEIDAKELVADVRVGLDELELMKKYQLSRLQLRAAVRRLQAGGFLREPQRPTLTVDAAQFVGDLRAGAPDGDLMDKYGLTEQNLQSVLDKLIEVGALDVSLLRERRVVADEGRLPEPVPTESRTAREEHEQAGSASSELEGTPEEAVEPAEAPVFPIGVLDAIREDSNAVERLLDDGLDVNALDGQLRRSALMWAGIYGNVETLRILLERGANVHAVDKHGKTALAHALARDQTEVAEILLNAGAQPNKAS